MQQVQGFSRLQTVPSEPATAARPKVWILSSWRDLILYVGTPLLLIPAFALAQARWSPQDIFLFVAPSERHTGYLLHVWRALYSAVRCKPRPKHNSRRSHF